MPVSYTHLFETRRALPSQKPKELLDLVLKEGDNAGIVYCSTTKQVDETARLLQSLSLIHISS